MLPVHIVNSGIDQAAIALKACTVFFPSLLDPVFKSRVDGGEDGSAVGGSFEYFCAGVWLRPQRASHAG